MKTTLPSRVLFHLLVLLSAIVSSRAVVYRTDGAGASGLGLEVSSLDASRWTTAWNGGSATVVAPCLFLTAAHLGGSVGQSVSFGGAAYRTTSVAVTGDLAVWSFAGAVSDYAPLTFDMPGIGSRIITAGRGMVAGDALLVHGVQAGWRWADGGGALRWGENLVSNSAGAYVRTEFSSENALRYEASLASGDSGAPLYVQQGGVWALAGIGYGVNSVHPDIDAGGNSIFASVWDRNLTWPQPLNDPRPPYGDTSFFSGFSPNSSWLASQGIAPIPEPEIANLAAVGLVFLCLRSITKRKTTDGN